MFGGEGALIFNFAKGGAYSMAWGLGDANSRIYGIAHNNSGYFHGSLYPYFLIT